MLAESIPGVEPMGDPDNPILLAIGIGLYVLALATVVVYLVWKLPRRKDGEE